MIKDPTLTTLRVAVEGDRRKLANLIHFGAFVHRHLDWRMALDWLGHEPFIIVEGENDFLAALACPPDPPNIAWIRLFAVYDDRRIAELWELLWESARDQLMQYSGLLKVAAIPLQSRFRSLLEDSDFISPHKVVVLSWSRNSHIPETRSPASNWIRPMLFDDLPSVEEIDRAAFGGVWQNSQPCLEIAFGQSSVATVAELDGVLVGYQISTATQVGGHLARLAVDPQYQGMGIGYSLVCDMLSQFKRRGAHHVTVNTQHDNLVSLSLYQKAGFSRTNEEFPLYEYSLV
jgi:ribosomal protein S18 acetylase RimI-like enzyme